MKQTKRLYISADLEGIAGVVKDQLMPGQFEYEQARQWMTNEVNAACEAALSQGIEEIFISDSHGNGQNLLLDKLSESVQVIRSWPRPLCMMEGIDQGMFVGAVLLGYHSGATQERGVLAHTLHGGGITQVRINDRVASETVISAATAAHFNVPVIMVSGDDAFVEHAKDVLDDTESKVETVVTKWALSRTSARTLLPQNACGMIAEGMKQALNRLHEFRAKAVACPVQLDVQCIKRGAADLISYLPTVNRVDSHTVRFIAQDMVEVSKILSFLLASGVLTATL